MVLGRVPLASSSPRPGPGSGLVRGAVNADHILVAVGVHGHLEIRRLVGRRLVGRELGRGAVHADHVPVAVGRELLYCRTCILVWEKGAGAVQ